MSMEFLIQQMKSHVTFSSSVMMLHWEKIWSPFSCGLRIKCGTKQRYWLILHHMKCISSSQISFTCDPQYFQERILFKLLFQGGKAGKMAVTSLNIYTTSHPLVRCHYVSRHWLLVRSFEAAIPLAHWKVNLRWHTTGCRQIQTVQCNILVLILIRLDF